MAVENFQGALRLYLMSDAAISAIVDTKIYAIPVPQNASLPYATIQRIGKETWNTLSNFSDVIIERWQIDAYAATASEVQAIEKAVFNKLHAKHHETWSGYKIEKSWFDNDNDLSEPANDGSEKMYHRIQQDFKIKRSYETTI